MATWRRIHPPAQDRQSGIRGYRDVIYFGTTDLGTDQLVGATYSTTVASVAEIEDNIPITDGQPHPDPGMAGAICISKRLIAGPSNGCAIVAAYFDSTVTFGGGGKRVELTYDTGSEPLWAPQANLFLYSTTAGPPPGDGSAWGKYNVVWTKVHDRQVITITERRLVFTAMDEDILCTRIAAEYGNGYVFGGIPCILKKARTHRIREGYYDITYIFESKARVQGRNASDGTGFLLNVPALDWFEEWRVDQSTDTTRIYAADGPSTIWAGGILP